MNAVRSIGFPIIMAPALPDGEVILAGRQLLIGTCPRSEIELAGYEARWRVRHLMADVCDWLDLPIGQSAPYTGQQVLERLKAAGEA